MTFDDLTAKLSETRGHQDDLAKARADADAKAASLASAQAAKLQADAAVVADVTTLDADRAELHRDIDALFPSQAAQP
jgi:hypothetical protein